MKAILKSIPVLLTIWLFCFFLAPMVNAAPFDLLIITPEEFMPALIPLRDHKNATGTPTEIITLEDIYRDYRGADEPESIKMAISHYENYNSIKYVMLVGDVDKFPVRWVAYAEPDQPENINYYFPSDLYYADLYNAGAFDNWDYNADGFYGEHLINDLCGADPFSVNVDHVDFHPDVAVGRVPASSMEEVESYVAKVIFYEYATANAADDWFYNMTFLAGKGRRCDPGIIFHDIQNDLGADFLYESYLHNSYYTADPDKPERPCNCTVGESLVDCMDRTGLTSDEIDVFTLADGRIGARPDACLEDIGFLAYHDHTSTIGDYRDVIDNSGKFTITFSDGCGDGGFAGHPPGRMGRFSPVSQNLDYETVDGRRFNVTAFYVPLDTDGDGDNEDYYQIFDCQIDGTAYPITGDHCGGGFFPDMTIVDDFDALGNLETLDRPYFLHPPAPAPLQPAGCDFEFNPESKLFSKNSGSGHETGWVGLVAATKGASFPANGELESLFFKSYTTPHPATGGGTNLGDMWRSMMEYWLDEIFDASGNFFLTGFFNKYSMDHDRWFAPYCAMSLQHAFMYSLFGDPSLRVGGVIGIEDTLPPVTSCPDGSFSNGSGSVEIPLTVTDYGSPPSGVRETMYRINSGWHASTHPTIEIPADGISDGNYTIHFFSEDFLGNTETEKTCSVVIDTTPPRTSILLDGNPPAMVFCVCTAGSGDCSCPAAGCFLDNVEITLNSADYPPPPPVVDPEPTEQWNHTFGGENNEFIYSLAETSGGGYVMAGKTSSSGAGRTDALLVKTDGNGVQEWVMTYGGSESDMVWQVRETADGGYVMAGGTSSSGAGCSDAWLIKTDNAGNEEWSRTFGGPDDDEARAVLETADNGFILAGYTDSLGTARELWLIKTDSHGNEEWSRTFGGNSTQEAWAMERTADGGYVICGHTFSPWPDRDDILVIKTDSAGIEVWSHTFNYPGNDACRDIKQTSDLGYIIAGYAHAEGREDLDGRIIKINADGSEEWNKNIGGFYLDLFNGVTQTLDGGYILAGKKATSHWADYDLWLCKTDGSGNKTWEMALGSTADDKGHDVMQLPDGSYLVAGTTESSGAGEYDGWLVKVEVTTPPPPDYPVSGVDFTEYYLADWDWSLIPTEYSGPFTVRGNGGQTLRYRSIDKAGNAEEYRQYSFCVLENPSSPAGIWRDRIRILAGLKELMAFRMRKDFASQLPPVNFVQYEYSPAVQNPKWITIGIDNDGSDGWQVPWDTTTVANGNYFIRMNVFGFPKGALKQNDPILYQEQLTVIVSNMEDSSYDFFLDGPPKAHRGESIKYEIKFTNKTDGSFYDLNLFCDLDPEFYSGIIVQDGGKLNEKGLPAWYLKELKKNESWIVHFIATARNDILPGTILTSQAVLSTNTVPRLLSDDPDTGESGDYTAVSINLVDGSIGGSIKDVILGTPLHALVTASGPVERQVMTGENGEYLLDALPPGGYLLEVNASGYFYHSPEGPVNVLIDGMGGQVRNDFYLVSGDHIGPEASFLHTADEIVDGNMSVIQGTAYDYSPGSGVSGVEVAIFRHNDRKYWNGTTWQENRKWLPVSGAADWNLSVRDISWNPGLAYTLEARAIDNAGNIGVPKRTTTTAEFRAPRLISPLDGADVQNKPTFVWSYLEDSYYRLQIADNIDFSQPYIDLAYLTLNSFTPAELVPGTWYWRVRASDILLGNSESDWSKIRTVTVQQPCAADYDNDGDVDGKDLAEKMWYMSTDPQELQMFATEFGQTGCQGNN